MKVVIDTNVVASAIFFGGRPREELCLKYNPKAPTLALNTLFPS